MHSCKLSGTTRLAGGFLKTKKPAGEGAGGPGKNIKGICNLLCNFHANIFQIKFNTANSTN